MKFIEKKMEDSRTGAVSNYHIVSGIQIDYINSSTFLTVASFVSKSKKDEGKDSLSINTFTIPGVPDYNTIPYEWALNKLIEQPPENFVPEDYVGYINPYIFAGGEVKDTN